jgi:hypothetical protein
MARLSRLAVCLVALVVQSASASPYRDNFVGFTVEGHSWGFWRIVDVPLDPDRRPYAFAAEGEKVEFVCYWCAGLGPYATVQVSQGLALSILSLTLVLAGIMIYRKSKKTEPCAAPNGGPATSHGNSGVAEGPPSVS